MALLIAFSSPLISLGPEIELDPFLVLTVSVGHIYIS